MKDYKIIFLRKTNGHAVGCVAINLTNLQGESVVLKNISYQVSIQSPKDKFDRSMARQLALGRLIEKPFKTTTVTTASIHMVVEAVMRDIVNNPRLSKRAKTAAKLWLSLKLKEDNV